MRHGMIHRTRQGGADGATDDGRTGVGGKVQNGARPSGAEQSGARPSGAARNGTRHRTKVETNPGGVWAPVVGSRRSPAILWMDGLLAMTCQGSATSHSQREVVCSRHAVCVENAGG